MEPSVRPGCNRYRDTYLIPFTKLPGRETIPVIFFSKQMLFDCHRFGLAYTRFQDRTAA